MMLQMSGLLGQLDQFSFDPAGQPLCIYGDPAYPLRAHLHAPYRNVSITADQVAFNASMSKVRSGYLGELFLALLFWTSKKILRLVLAPLVQCTLPVHF